MEKASPDFLRTCKKNKCLSTGVHFKMDWSVSIGPFAHRGVEMQPWRRQTVGSSNTRSTSFVLNDLSFVSLGGRRHQDGRKDQESKEQEGKMSFKRKSWTII